MTAAPVRLQLRRTAGFRLQDVSWAANGRTATRCVRPGPWGNPFPWSGSWITWAAVALGYRADAPGRRAAAVAYHLFWMTRIVHSGPLSATPGQIISLDGFQIPPDVTLYANAPTGDAPGDAARATAANLADWHRAERGEIPAPPAPDAIRAALAGRNLACWCPPDGPCHADTLLAIAATSRGTPLDPALFAPEPAPCP